MSRTTPLILAILMLTTIFSGCLGDSVINGGGDNDEERNIVLVACSGGIKNNSDCNVGTAGVGFGEGPMQPAELFNSNDEGNEPYNPLENDTFDNLMPSYEGVLFESSSGTDGRSLCASEDLVGLTNADLQTYLIGETDACLYYFWTFDSNLASTLTDSNVQWIANSVESMASTYGGNNDQGIHQLLFFIRIAYYYDFYSYIGDLDQTTFDAAYNAVDALKDSGHIMDAGDEARKNLRQMIILADTANFAEILIPHFLVILETLTDDISLDIYWTSLTVYSALYSIKRSTDKPAFNAHGDLLELLERMGELSIDADGTLISGDEEWVVNWAIWAFARLAFTDAPVLYDLGCEYVINAENHHYSATEYTMPFLWAVYTHDYYYNYYPDDVCVNPVQEFSMDELRDSLESQLFPNTFTFDDGKVIVKTSLSSEDIIPLYYAVKEVGAQFFRISESSLPVDEDPNHNITMIIYGSRAEYRQYQPIIYGLNSNNGGMYIEQWGKFFTYERTPSESIYTLEELVRHEYVHYLVGRHLVFDMWGVNEFYDDNRLTWFNEGLAEFLAGSTERDGIAPRLSVMERIDNDGTNRLTTNQVFASSYNSGFKFYRYSSALFDYMYYEHDQTLRDLFECVNLDDVDCYDSIVEGLITDSSFEDGYQLHIDEMLLSLSTYTVPSAEFLDNDDLDYIESDFVENEIRRTSHYGYDVECDFAVKNSLQRYRCIGTLHVNETADSTTEQSWSEFNKQLDELLNDIIGNPDLSNLDDAVCWFDRILIEPTVRSTFNHSTAYHCEIPLPQGQYSADNVLVQLNEDVNRTHANGSIECLELAIDYHYSCKIHVESAWFESNTDDGVLIDSLNMYGREIANQIHAANPATYARTVCTLSDDYQYHDVASSYTFASSFLLCQWTIGNL